MQLWAHRIYYNSILFSASDFCSREQGEWYLSYDKKASKFLDGRPEQLLNVLCTIPQRPKIVAEGIENGYLSCPACTEILEETAKSIKVEFMKDFIEEKCQSILKMVYNLDNPHFCTFLSNVVDFGRKYFTSTICSLLKSCNFEEVSLFHKGQLEDVTLDCDDCRNSYGVLKEKLGIFFNEHQDAISFIMYSIFGSKRPANILFAGEEGLRNVIERILVHQDNTNICPNCNISNMASTPSTVAPQETVRVSKEPFAFTLKIFNNNEVNGRALTALDSRVVIQDDISVGAGRQMWFQFGPRLVSYWSGLVLTFTRNGTCLMPFDEENTNQELEFQVFQNGRFKIVSNDLILQPKDEDFGNEIDVGATFQEAPYQQWSDQSWSIILK